MAQKEHHCAWPAIDLYEDDIAPAEAQAQPVEHYTASNEMSAAAVAEQESELWGQPQPTEHETVASPVPAVPTHAFPHDTETQSHAGNGTVFHDMYTPNTTRRRSSTFEDSRLPRWARDCGACHDTDTTQVNDTNLAAAEHTEKHARASTLEGMVRSRSSSLRRLLHFNHGAGVETADGKVPLGTGVVVGLDQLKRQRSTKYTGVPPCTIEETMHGADWGCVTLAPTEHLDS